MHASGVSSKEKDGSPLKKQRQRSRDLSSALGNIYWNRHAEKVEVQFLITESTGFSPARWPQTLRWGCLPVSLPATRLTLLP